MEVEAGFERMINEASRDIKNNLLDPQQIRSLGMILLSIGLLKDENYFFVLSNALYSLADAMASFLRVSSMPLSLEYRDRTEKILEDIKNMIAQALIDMSQAVKSHNSCKAMETAAVLLKLSYKLNNMSENLKNIAIVTPAEE
ncbi:MAG: hypothetical protein ACPLRJ_00595 [Infirmifilum uzonense]|uniref:hypothetical protein n=1 Tax=Infirmifilum uzonense TaxID=1550241 RepID=UPI003C712F05